MSARPGRLETLVGAASVVSVPDDRPLPESLLPGAGTGNVGAAASRSCAVP